LRGWLGVLNNSEEPVGHGRGIVRGRPRLECVVVELRILLQEKRISWISIQGVFLKEGLISLIEEEEKGVSIDKEVEIRRTEIDSRKDNVDNNFDCAKGGYENSVYNEDTNVVSDEKVIRIEIVHDEVARTEVRDRVLWDVSSIDNVLVGRGRMAGIPQYDSLGDSL
jgi:hypothetical protein